MICQATENCDIEELAEKKNRTFAFMVYVATVWLRLYEVDDSLLLGREASGIWFDYSALSGKM